MLRREGPGGGRDPASRHAAPVPRVPHPITHTTPAAVATARCACVCACARARTERAEVTRGVVDLADGGEVPVGAARAARDAADEERRVRALHEVCSGYARGVVGMEGSR